MTNTLDIAIIGAGPAGLMAAEAAATSGARVIVFDRMASPARKFLMAGRGGLNLTHGEPLDVFLDRYGAAKGWLAPFVQALPPQALRDWAHALGEETFVGTSGRVFPKSFKASPLLRVWLKKLATLGVELRTRHTLVNMERDGDSHWRLQFETPEGLQTVACRACVLALGGASWPRLGSDGRWTTLLHDLGVSVSPLQPSNCGFDIAWSQVMKRLAGTPLKSIMLTGTGRSLRGECVITEHGLEGGAIYALSAGLRDEIAARGQAELRLDLRPDVSLETLASRLSAPRGKQSMSSFLRKAGGLSSVASALVREPGPLPNDPREMAKRIKDVVLRIDAPRPIARAISTAGGVRFDDLDHDLMIRTRPGLFVAGEMLDWEAPTGGYLLQACFATGAWAGRAAAAFARGRAD